MKAFVFKILMAVLASTFLAFIISIFPDLSANRNYPALSANRNYQTELLPVFKDRSYTNLTGEHLVDFILSQKIQMSIQHIDFYLHKIFLELSAGGLKKQTADQELVRIICQMLEETENVDEVQILVHYNSDETLLVEAKKSDLQGIGLKRLKALSDQEILEKVFKTTSFSSHSFR